MAKYPYLIRVKGFPPYWHDFEHSSTNDMKTHVDSIAISGDSFTPGVDSGSLSGCLYYRFPADSIVSIQVYNPQ